MHPHSVLVTMTGYDRPGVTSALFDSLAAHDVEVLDVEQIVVHGRLVLGVVLALRGDPGPLRRAAIGAGEALGTEIEVVVSDEAGDPTRRRRHRHHVLLLGRPLRAGAVGEVTRRIADLGGTVDSIARLAKAPATALEMDVSGVGHNSLGATLLAAAKETGIDIAVERSGTQRRAKRLLLVDVDDTLLRGDAFALLAERAGRADDDARLLAGTRSADRDSADVIRARAALCAGLPVRDLDAVRDQLRPAPGAAALVLALKRTGYRVGALSGGVAQIAEALLSGLGLDATEANVLQTADGRLTGRILGDVVDGAGRARALSRFAEAYGVPLNQTVAVGGSPGDAEMLSLAGLAVTFTPPSGGGSHHPLGGAYLETLLYVLGLSVDELDPPPRPVRALPGLAPAPG